MAIVENEENEEHVEYWAEPTMEAFHADDSYVRGLRGPIGSGKSVAMVFECIGRGKRQAAGPDGIRRSRCAIIRNTYPELKTTTVNTWKDWIPENHYPINWGTPITCRVVVPLKDGTTMDMEVVFLALDRPADIKKLLSLELTFAWINEARELPHEIVEAVTSRLGRFPGKKYGAPITWTGLFMDTNPPDDDHWWYRMFEVEKPRNWRQFSQPPALIKYGEDYMPNPDAENIKNLQLGYDYYLNMLGGKTYDWIKVYIMGQYGTVQDGKPVYPEYVDSLHCAEEELEPIRGLPLRLGWDFGLTPAVAIFQQTPGGGIIVIEEVVSEDMGIRRFSRDMVKPVLANRYEGMILVSTGDPAGTQRVQTEENTCMQVLMEEGIATQPAHTQEYIARRESVADFLVSTDIDGKPAFQLSPRCRILRKGFNGAYKYERIQAAGQGYEVRHKDRPGKSRFSHVHEGLQYGVMELTRGYKIERPKSRQVQRRTSRGWAA